jgi:prepilin-type N-terminal cleavage/methylation domain-containing protein
MTKKGFTLIELLVVIVIIGVLVAIALPNFIKVKDKAKEAEVKQNVHAIQIALERYAVDSPANNYPNLIMGGDWTDTYVVWAQWLTDQGLDPARDIPNAGRAGAWLPAATDVGDPIIMESYMASYPRNPFIRAKASTILPTLRHVFPGTASGGCYRAAIQGIDANKMVEIFGPPRFSTNQSIIGDLYVHHMYDNPPYDDTQSLKNPPGGWVRPSGNKRLVGNFSYYVRGMEGTSTPIYGFGDVLGYTLAGYGSLRNPAQDVYNRNGNYKGCYRTVACTFQCIYGLVFGEIPCLCSTGLPPSPVRNDGGSDTIPDGVIVTLDSGVDKKSSRVDYNTTEGDR